MTPTARSLAWLRKRGYTADVVERWIGPAKVRKDFLGFADILAVSADYQGVLAVQACTGASLSARLQKLAYHCEHLPLWKRTGNRVHIHAWSKRGAKGARKLWTVDERHL